MILGPPSSTRTHTLFSYSTLFRSRRDRGRARVVHAVLHRHRLDLDRAADAVQGMGRRHELSWRPAWRAGGWLVVVAPRSEEHTSELQSLMRTSYAVFSFKKKTRNFNKPLTSHLTPQSNQTHD